MGAPAASLPAYQPFIAERSDHLLLLLARSPEGRLRPAHLTRAAFILGREAKTDVGDAYYGFEPGDYGPASPQIGDDLKALNQRRLVLSTASSLRNRDAEHVITKTGLARADAFAQTMPTAFVAYADKLAQWVAPLDFVAMCVSVLEKYPEYRQHTLFTQG
jgi:hypothetical protein